MTQSSRAKVWLNRVGTLMGVAGVVFVIERLWFYAGEIDLAGIRASVYLTIACLAAAYGTSNLLLARGWWRLLVWLKADADWTWSLKTYAISQLAKYMPGSIFQFAGRQAIGASAGIPNSVLAKSTLTELAVLIGAGTLFIIPSAPLLFRWLDPALLTPAGSFIATVIFLLTAFLALAGASRIGGRALGQATLSYLLFLGVSGLIFATCFHVAGGGFTTAVTPAVAGAYVVAWLAGLLTPGSPAGLGMREAALLFLLGGLVPDPVVLLAIVISRVVTVLGDFGFWVIGILRVT
jgi:uncharacterized membrane protein YbhN (UPF0104 family)